MSVLSNIPGVSADVSCIWPRLHLEKAEYLRGQREWVCQLRAPTWQNPCQKTCPLQSPWWLLWARLVDGSLPIVQRLSLCIYWVTSSQSHKRQINKTNMKTMSHIMINSILLFFFVDVGGGDSCLLLFLLCLVTVVISLGGTALYCALGDAQSSVCQDFSRNAEFYMGQLRRGISHIQHWFTPRS